VLVFARYRMQAFMKAWQYAPAGQVIFAGPQAHVAVTRCSVAHGDRAFGLAFASATPTDVAVASSAIAKILNMVCPPLEDISHR
jgi:hypothetical protein